MGSRGRERKPAPQLKLQAFAAVSPGLEDALLDELDELGLHAEAVGGGVTFPADLALIGAIHLHSRLAARVSVTVAKIPARTLDALAAGIRAVDWRPFVHPGQPIEVAFTSRRSHLKHKETVRKKVAIAIADALRGPRLPGPRPPREPVGVGIHLDADRATVTVDASGELLHKRGWRKATGKAPLRENLAAAVLRLARWSPGEPLVDPMCGSGTFAIEAAGIALGHAPGARRTFAFERWPCLDAKAWEQQRARARQTTTLDARAPILAADRDDGAVTATRANADRAQVAGRIRVLASRFEDLEPPAPSGLVVMNPPYGERIGGGGGAGRGFRAIGGVLRARWPGWRVAILLPGPQHLGALGLSLEPVTTFSNGGIPVILAVGPRPDPSDEA